MSSTTGESVDGINYTQYFKSEKVYDTLDEACQAAKNTAQVLGFSLVKGSKKMNDPEYESRMYMYCSRGGKRRSTSLNKRKAKKSKKSDCPFQVAVRGWMVEGAWRFKIDGVQDTKNRKLTKGYHNHSCVLFPEGSKEMNVPIDAGKKDITEMAATHTEPNNLI
ncbi:hypothetical protein LINGRAHAP2_LOCUS16426 [Linum grandiflorum]